MKNYKGKWLEKPSTQQERIPTIWEKWQEKETAKSWKGKEPKGWGRLPKGTSEWKVSKGLSGKHHQKEKLTRNK